MKLKSRIENYDTTISKLFHEEVAESLKNTRDGNSTGIRTLTFQVTDACNLACKYCYQGNKSEHVMPIGVAQKFIDMVLDCDENTARYIDADNAPAVVLEFIGGEPFLQVELIDEIIDYFLKACIARHHHWATRYRISICSNGILYFDPKVQAFLKKHRENLSFSISIDGNKRLHDSCRVFPNGEGSYDIAIRGVDHWVNEMGGVMGSKMTLAPGNIMFAAEAVESLLEHGYEDINLNCVYEKGWTEEHATIFYNQLKKLADYVFTNGHDDKRISIFEEHFFHPKELTDSQNWCWAAGTPILTTNGYKPVKEIAVGDLVFTEDGTIHPVINIMSHEAHNLVRLSGSGIWDLICTDDHCLYAQPKGKPYGKYSVKELTPEDEVRLAQVPTSYLMKMPNSKELTRLIIHSLGKTTWTSEEDESIIAENPAIDFHDDMMWLKGLTITPLEVQFDIVYNFTVADNHSYIAGGLVSSNCGGNGMMISVDWKGDIFPCIRYMESSLGNDVSPLVVGNVNDGICVKPEHKACSDCLKAVNRLTQSTEECLKCPIAEGCSWCQAYNYQDSGGDINHRATYICVMHKARALANCYYWNMYYRLHNENKRFKLWLPDDEALKIISQEELDYLHFLEN